jgi:hypothetical protein
VSPTLKVIGMTVWVGIHESSPNDGDSGSSDLTEVALAECIC